MTSRRCLPRLRKPPGFPRVAGIATRWVGTGIGRWGSCFLLSYDLLDSPHVLIADFQVGEVADGADEIFGDFDHRTMSLVLVLSAEASRSRLENWKSCPLKILRSVVRENPTSFATATSDLSPISFRIFSMFSGITPSQKEGIPAAEVGEVELLFLLPQPGPHIVNSRE